MKTCLTILFAITTIALAARVDAQPRWSLWQQSAEKPWTPAARGTGRIACWDPNVVTSVTPTTGSLVDGSLVLSIADSVSSVVLSRFTTGYEPTYKTNVLRGNAALRYAGLTQSMRTLTDALATQATWTIMVVAQGSSPGSSATLFTLSNDANGYVSFLANTATPTSRAQNGLLVTNGSDKNLTAGWIGSNLHSFWQLNGGTHATHSINIDGVAQTLTDGSNVADPGATSRQHRFILGSTAGIVNPFTGDFFYVEILDHVATATDVANYEVYYRGRFGTP